MLSAWLANKTPENLRAWITDEASFDVVAVRDDRVCGYGRIIKEGTIQMCYVTPEVQHCGVGKRRVTP